MSACILRMLARDGVGSGPLDNLELASRAVEDGPHDQPD